ncbi:EamA family transporter [Flavobacterium silvaticum]|uniref:EamA family transporter n=1 Tax=Flavobacterium silvaticum TaxID=1852020 RepID=A0A972JGB9_9FLAO|nr:EamA family transporter [Flavobacterium silvaticum]NMH28889.1 EamA family transporter [Flavobacterium silvaticum]
MKSKYYLSAITAYSVWGLFSLVLRPLKTFVPLDILYNRVAACTVIIFLIIVFFRKEQLRQLKQKFASLSKKEKVKLVLWNIFMGLLLTGNWFLFIYVMNYISVRATSLSYLVCPILTALLAAILLKEKLDTFQWCGIFLGISGCGILSFGHFYDLMLSVLVALSYALYLILQKKNAGFDPVLLLSFHFLIALAALSPVAGFHLMEFHPTIFYILIVVIAVFFTVMPLWLNLFALKGLDSATVGMLINVNPIIAFTLAILYFREKASVLEIVGYSVVFVSVIVFNLKAILGRRKTQTL